MQTPARVFHTIDISPDLQLVRLALADPPASRAPTPRHRIVVVDCSGSMARDLPRVRGHLKKIVQAMHERDRLSVVWFSGRTQHGVLIENEPVADLRDLQRVSALIDRWLAPVGLTGFREPLLDVLELSRKSELPVTLFFMSDGCDNQWSASDIFGAVRVLAAEGRVTNTTVVEYGYDADRQLLTKIASELGGTIAFADSFSAWAPALERSVTELGRATTTSWSIPFDVVGGRAWTVEDGEIVQFLLEAGETTSDATVRVPSDVDAIYFLHAPDAGDPLNKHRYVNLARGEAPQDLGALWTAMAVFALHGHADVIRAILRRTEDVRFARLFAGCFGKQQYSNFQREALLAGLDSTRRYVDGRDASVVPSPDAFTIFDLLAILQEDETTRVLLDHPAMSYHRIGRQQVDVEELLTAEELARLDHLREELERVKLARRVRVIQAEIDAILSTKREALVFTAARAADGYPIADLVFNEERANLSIRVIKTGTVDLQARVDAARVTGTLPHEGAAGQLSFPVTFSTHIWRTYTLVRDGIVHVAALPIRAAVETIEKLRRAGVQVSTIADDAYAVILTGIPVINERMATRVSVEDLATREMKICRLRARQKVVNALVSEHEAVGGERPTPASWEQIYGAASAAFLEACGLSAGGFHPKRVAAPKTDYYVSRKLEVTIRAPRGQGSWQSLPPVAKVREQLAAGKTLLGPQDDMARQLLAATSMRCGGDEAYQSWLVDQQTDVRLALREQLREKAKLVFSAIVGQQFPAQAEPVTLGDVTVTAALVEEEVWI